MSANINKSAYNFLMCLKFIFSHNIFSIEELTLYLNTNYNISLEKETILKYLRTLKQVGFEFQRINNKKYKLLKIPLELSLSCNDKNILVKCNNLYKTYLATAAEGNENNFFQKLSPLLPKGTKLDLKNKTDKLICTLRQYCKDNLQLNIVFLEKQNLKRKYLFEPDKVLLLDKIIYLKGYNVSLKTTMLLNINNIIQVKQTPLKNKFLFDKQFVKLKILSKFANTYVLKDEEEVVNKKQDELIINSYYYDKKLFFKNILRYMDNCEILSPDSLRKEFLQYTNEIFLLYNRE